MPVKVTVSGVLCVYLTHDSLTGLMGLTEINKNNTTIARIVKLTANKTGNDRAKTKKAGDGGKDKGMYAEMTEQLL